MIETVDNFLKKYELNNSENTFFVGFSGGCDSLCLIDILKTLTDKYNFKLIALHLNHNWRGEESEQEEKSCQSFCKKNNIEYISEKLEKTEQKTEQYAREARYEFFTRHAKKYPNSCIFTAHTMSDNAETLIYRIIKGTGTKGLQGILPQSIRENIKIFRPLLTFSRQNIEDYCNSKGLVANTDSSNFDISYKRNFIRHKIMPLFKEINFQAEKSINNLSQIAIRQSNIIDEYINGVIKEIYSNKKILTEKFKNLSEDVMQQIIYEACLKFNLDYDSKKIKNILSFIKANFESKSGSRYSLTNELWLFANSKHIYLITKVKADKNEKEIIISSEGTWDFSDTKAFSLEKYEDKVECKFPSENAPYAYVDLSKTGLNFSLRTRRDGDFITPFGMSGSMKLKKYLNSKGISQHEKDGLLMLCQGAEVLWVSEVGLSNKLKVVNKPTHVIRLIYKEKTESAEGIKNGY